jgi:hypothetical protein
VQRDRRGITKTSIFIVGNRLFLKDMLKHTENDVIGKTMCKINESDIPQGGQQIVTADTSELSSRKHNQTETLRRGQRNH